jgi:hypothetical protein
MTSPLSPAAQAVMDALINVPLGSCYYPAYRRRQVAAVIHAAADQVVPLGTASNCSDQAIHATSTRIKLLAIVAELRANNAEAPPS